jgi:hypothetical protein
VQPCVSCSLSSSGISQAVEIRRYGEFPDQPHGLHVSVMRLARLFRRRIVRFVGRANFEVFLPLQTMVQPIAKHNSAVVSTGGVREDK